MWVTAPRPHLAVWRSSSFVSVELCGILSAPGDGHQIEVLEHREDRLAFGESCSA
jgi:hypothetical protein